MVNQEEIHKKCFSNNTYDREEAAILLKTNFESLDKMRAWEDLIRLVYDENKDVQNEAECALTVVYQHLPDQNQAFADTIQLFSDRCIEARSRVAWILDINFRHLSDKQQVWINLHQITSDKNFYVRQCAAGAIENSFQYLPDKQQAWEDLIKLTSDEHESVRAFAGHALGKISVFNATEAENDNEYRQQLELAIRFFEMSDYEYISGGPSSFCLPFYRSFHMIIFAEKQQAKDEIKNYLEEAKNAIKGSKNKELLFEAVENLANALKEIQNLENVDLATKKVELNFYRNYCEQAAKLMIETEVASPYATELIRKGLPILDRKLKSLLEEIQEKAKTACRESQGTDTEEIACAVSREVQKWEISNPADMAEYIEDISYSLKGKVQSHPENEYLLRKIELMRNDTDLTKKFQLLSYIIGEIPTIKVVPEETIRNGFNEIKQDIAAVDEKIEKIKISLKPGIREELIVSVGPKIGGVGFEHTITIPLHEISYSELKEDLKKIAGIDIEHFSKLPKRLAEKIKGYLKKTGRIDILEKFT